MSQFAPEDTARHYESSHHRIVELARSLSDEQLAARIPATPRWVVHDALAHLAANTTDGLAGRITGLPDDAFTDEQVRQRKDMSVEEIVAEWQGNMPAILDATRAGFVPPNIAVDAVTHEQDIRGAVGAGRVEDREAVRFSLEVFAAGLVYQLSKADGLALRLVATDSDFSVVAGSGEQPATLRATEFELLRVLSGRRGRRNVLALEWEGDGAAYLPWLNMFGEVPDYDVVD